MINNKEKVSKLFYALSFLLLSVIFFIVSVSSVLFLFGVSINVFGFVFAVLLAIFSLIVFAKKNGLDRKDILKISLIGLFVFAFSVFINTKIYDISWDGNCYHKSAVGMMADGWNPAKETPIDFIKSGRRSVKESGEELKRDYIYERHYAKASWIFAANIYKLTGNIEAGHSINILSLIMGISLVFAFLIKRVKVWQAAVWSVAAIFNPIIASQIFTYYNDGLQGIFVISIVVVLLDMVSSKKAINDRWKYLVFFMLASLLVNIKFTGVMFFGLYSMVFLLYVLWNKELRRVALGKIFFTGIVLFIWSFLVIGFSSYVKNQIEYGHPLYPLAGGNKVDIMKGNSPAIFFHDKRPFVPMLKSLFSKASNMGYAGEEKPTIKIPFTFTLEELRAISSVDTRISGNGVLFGGIIILFLPILLYGFFAFYKKNKNDFLIYLCVLIPTGLILLVVKEAWWARYIPHLSGVVVLVLIMNSRFRTRINRALIPIITVLILFNNFLIFNLNYVGKMEYTRSLKSEYILSLKEKECLNVDLLGPAFYGSLYSLKDNVGKRWISVRHQKIKNNQYRDFMNYIKIEN